MMKAIRVSITVPPVRADNPKEVAMRWACSQAADFALKWGVKSVRVDLVEETDFGKTFTFDIVGNDNAAQTREVP